MKNISLLGSILLSCSLFAMEESPSNMVLHFNDGQQRALSAELAQHIPGLTSCERSSEVDFTLLSSSDWDILAPFLPFIKDIRTSQVEDYDLYGPPTYERINLDTNYQSDNMAMLFLNMKKLCLPQLIRVIWVANFLQIKEIEVIAQSIFLKKLKRTDQFDLFVKEKYFFTTDIEQNIRDIAPLNWKNFDLTHSFKCKFSGSYDKSDFPFVTKHIYFLYKNDQLLKAKKREIHRLSRYQRAAHIHYLSPKLSLNYESPTNLSFIQSLFLTHLKKYWKKLNLKDSQNRHKPIDFKETHNNGSHAYYRLINPKYQVQVCKHTYPNSSGLYQSLDPKNSPLLKELTTTANCTSCAIEQEEIADQLSLDNWIETSYQQDK